MSYIYDISSPRVNQPDATVSQVYYLTFICRSTCFGRLHAHHQELTTVLAAFGFTLERGGSSVVGRGLARPRPATLLPPRSKVKPEAANAVVSSWWWAWKRPKTCWATYKPQVINLWNCCIWLVNLFELYDYAWICQRQTKTKHRKKWTKQQTNRTDRHIDRHINPLNPELNPICYLLALLGAHHFLHVSRIRVKLLTFRLRMSYIYGASILDVSRSHTRTQHSR